MKHFVILAVLGIVPLIYANAIINLDVAIPCKDAEACSPYSNNATCIDGFCVCRTGNETYNCSSKGITPNGMKPTGAMYHPCKQDQGCNIPGTVCNTTNSQCVCDTAHVLSSNRHSCLKKATAMSFPCADEKQCLAFLPNTTCYGNVCVCIPDFHFAENRCYKKIGFGEVCTEDGECSHIDGAMCTEKEICGCPAETVIDMDVKKCLPVAREILQECSENKQCSMTFTNSICIDKKCQCREGFHYESEMSRCFQSKGVDENCGNDFECYQVNEGENVTGKALQCVSNTCVCADDYFRDGSKCVNAASLLDWNITLLVPILLQILFTWS